MIALLLAAQLSTAPVPALDPVPAPVQVAAAPAPFEMPGLRTRAFRGLGGPACNGVYSHVVYRGFGEYRRLDQLPPGGMEYAVLRRVDGCMVPAPMGYHIVTAAPVQMPREAPPAKPEDAPPNRR
jgi:hypothetical protein